MLFRSIIFSYLLFCSQLALATTAEFSEFALELPQGWEASEHSGFITKDRNEYMLIISKKDQEEQKYLAHISIYLLPNKEHKSSEQWATDLCAMQAETTQPVQAGQFWFFTGNPRDNVLKGRGTTIVTSDPTTLAIIIVKDPSDLKAKEILPSLRPISKRAQDLFKENINFMK